MLDIEGDELTFGKPIGSDEIKGKLTYPAVFGLAKSKDYARHYIDEAVQEISVFQGSADLSTLALSILNRVK